MSSTLQRQSRVSAVIFLWPKNGKLGKFKWKRYFTGETPARNIIFYAPSQRDRKKAGQPHTIAPTPAQANKERPHHTHILGREGLREPRATCYGVRQRKRDHRRRFGEAHASARVVGAEARQGEEQLGPPHVRVAGARSQNRMLHLQRGKSPPANGKLALLRVQDNALRRVVNR